MLFFIAQHKVITLQTIAVAIIVAFFALSGDSDKLPLLYTIAFKSEKSQSRKSNI